MGFSRTRARTRVPCIGRQILKRWGRPSASPFPSFLFKVMSRYISGHMPRSVLEQLGRVGVFGTNIFASSGKRAVVLLQLAAACPRCSVMFVVGGSFTWLALLPDLGCSQRHPPSSLLRASSSHFSGSKEGPFSLSSGSLYYNSKLPNCPWYLTGEVKEYRQSFPKTVAYSLRLFSCRRIPSACHKPWSLSWHSFGTKF